MQSMPSSWPKQVSLMMTIRLGCYMGQEHILQLGHWLLQLKRALKATVHGASFESVAKVEDIEDEVFWKNFLSVEGSFSSSENIAVP